MIMFMLLDLFYVNEYVEWVLFYVMGDFVKQYYERVNDILICIFGVELIIGMVLDVGVQRWNEDGSVNVLVVIQIILKFVDGKWVVLNVNCWLVMVKQEGNEWKISSLFLVI